MLTILGVSTRNIDLTVRFSSTLARFTRHHSAVSEHIVFRRPLLFPTPSVDLDSGCPLSRAVDKNGRRSKLFENYDKALLYALRRQAHLWLLPEQPEQGDVILNNGTGQVQEPGHACPVPARGSMTDHLRPK